MASLINFFQLVLEDQWAVNGVHYSKTLEAWLKLFDEKYVSQIKPIFEATYGKPATFYVFLNKV
jgi:cyclopropane-fatty-acyl-phospholipid synthase